MYKNSIDYTVFVFVLIMCMIFEAIRRIQFRKEIETIREANLDNMAHAIRLYITESVRVYSDFQNTLWHSAETPPDDFSYVIVGLIDPNFEPSTVVRPARFVNGKFYNLEPFFIPDITIEYAELQNVVKWRYLPKFQ